MLLYYITDRAQFAGNEAVRQQRLLEKIAEAARCGVDFIQLREKDLPGRDLEHLALEAVRVIHENSPLIVGSQERQTQLLINSRTDVVISCGADGVHLQSRDVLPADVRNIWNKAIVNLAGDARQLKVAVSCHTLSEVMRAEEGGANFAVLGPVFEKKATPELQPLGLGLLEQACARQIPVLALGGINLENARLCVEAGAAGIAAIRMFQENDIEEVVRRLR
jgi:thiamine-phosphate pyrophosphorylase